MTIAFQQGYEANSIYQNPYWKNYPVEKGVSKEEQLDARVWVDGYVQKIIDSRNKN